MLRSSTPPTPQSEMPVKHSADERYSDAAVQAILQKALSLRAHQHFSGQELAEMAAELAISPEMLAAAVADWEAEQSVEPLQPVTEQSQTAIKPRLKQSQRRSWRQYAIACTLMIGIDLLTAGALTWSIFPVLGWGLGLMCGGCSRDRSSSRSC